MTKVEAALPIHFLPLDAGKSRRQSLLKALNTFKLDRDPRLDPVGRRVQYVESLDPNLVDCRAKLSRGYPYRIHKATDSDTLSARLLPP